VASIASRYRFSTAASRSASATRHSSSLASTAAFDIEDARWALRARAPNSVKNVDRETIAVAGK